MSKDYFLKQFWQFDDDQINKILDIAYSSKAWLEALNTSNPLRWFAENKQIVELAHLYIRCDRNMLVTKLSWEQPQ